MARQHILGYLVPMTTEVSTDYIMPSTVTSKLTDCTTSQKHIYNLVKVFSMVLVSIWRKKLLQTYSTVITQQTVTHDCTQTKQLLR